ncbi:MAG TPA: 50S ribosomal protein L4 [Actinomycetota bacterium]|nr:50S ribosomal protein L4 [Actinomycetota bacterium]
MASVDVFDARGSKASTRELAADVFEAPVNVPLMHQVVVAGMASIRAGTHKAKTRGEVRGGGKKPWRQKGTGRARQGSIRAPQWAGGGVAHGPVTRDHAMRVNQKMRRGALRSALSDAAASGKLAAIQELAWDEPRTKRAVEVVDALELTGLILVVLDEPTDGGAVERSFRNLPNVKIAYAGGLGVYDLLRADRVLITTAALDVVERVGSASESGESGEAA